MAWTAATAGMARPTPAAEQAARAAAGTKNRINRGRAKREAAVRASSSSGTQDDYIPVIFNGSPVEAIVLNGVRLTGLVVDGIRLYMKKRREKRCFA